ncbi:MAG: Crp/Fnr family transcriptional regulator [Bryobacteraceae bacterium]
MSIGEAIEALGESMLFQGLGHAELRLLAEHSVSRRLQRGQVLYLVGEEARGLYVIVRGALRLLRQNHGGREQVLCVERAGETLGDVPVFDGGTHFSTAVADGDAEVLFISKQDIHRLCLEHPQMPFHALKVMASRVRRFAELVEALSLHEVDRRVAWFLLKEAQQRGIAAGTGTLFELTLTHRQIASRIGTVREMVSRALGHLQKSGLIAMKGRLVRIPDREKLAQHAMGGSVIAQSHRLVQ